jgi:uncharacterized protein YxeA
MPLATRMQEQLLRRRVEEQRFFTNSNSNSNSNNSSNTMLVTFSLSSLAQLTIQDARASYSSEAFDTSGGEYSLGGTANRTKRPNSYMYAIDVSASIRNVEYTNVVDIPAIIASVAHAME